MGASAAVVSNQPQQHPSVTQAANPHHYHATRDFLLRRDMPTYAEHHTMFAGLQGPPDPFSGLHDPMQSWAAQHHMSQNQMYPSYGMAHHVATAAAASSPAAAGAFFSIHEVAGILHRR